MNTEYLKGTFSHAMYDDCVSENHTLFLYFENVTLQDLGICQHRDTKHNTNMQTYQECCLHLSPETYQKMRQYFIDHPTLESM